MVHPEQLAALEVFAGSPEADLLSSEALTLGQALSVDANTLSGLFVTRGIYLNFAGRCRPQAAAYFREAARLATQGGDTLSLGRALFSLSDPLAGTDPAAAAEAARTAAGHLRRAGAREFLSVAIGNLGQALLMLGEWDAAEAELGQGADSGGLADHEFLAWYRGWLAALRGDADTAEATLAELRDLRASEDHQDQATVSLLQAFAAAARGQGDTALCHARGVLDHAGALGISHELLRWAWPLAVRTACDLHDTAAIGELLALLDSYMPGHLAPVQRAERDLVCTRLPADGDPAAGVPRTIGSACCPLPQSSESRSYRIRRLGRLAGGAVLHAQ